jgi:hypothetical protein
MQKGQGGEEARGVESEATWLYQGEGREGSTAKGEHGCG